MIMGSECGKFVVNLSAYFDEELEDAAAEAMKRHLMTCEACRADLEKMGHIHELFAATVKMLPGRNTMVEDIFAKLKQAERNK